MKIIQLSFGRFEFFPELIIGTIDKDVHYDNEKNDELMKIVSNHYTEGTPIAYVSLRKNEYTIDPTIHRRNLQNISLCAIAVVENKPVYQSTVRLESRFFKPNKLKSFNNIKDALTWTNKEVALKMKQLKKVAF